jgi:hypothetical protein
VSGAAVRDRVVVAAGSDHGHVLKDRDRHAELVSARGSGGAEGGGWKQVAGRGSFGGRRKRQKKANPDRPALQVLTPQTQGTMANEIRTPVY